ncbi:MAG TPA: peptide ABC transporter substrate-binding protein, partial [Termitinemataceae bacterium]|nr:peptide ABC transporter substrate-binding protein [Termitinemataceae bacterium]HOM24393.1 peptide ABC transporter substrate-binding protein [Termitinemataceae bacterium]
MRRSIFFGALGVLALVLVVTACGPTADKAEFIVNNAAEPQTLDPSLIQGVPEHRIYMALFEGLTIYDPKTSKAIPGIAESWTISEDGTV